MTFLIRAAGEPGPLVEVVRRTIPKAAAGHTVISANTFARINLIGSQEMRSREFAVRIAVGASAADLNRLVAAQSSS